MQGKLRVAVKALGLTSYPDPPSLIIIMIMVVMMMKMMMVMMVMLILMTCYPDPV